MYYSQINRGLYYKFLNDMLLNIYFLFTIYIFIL